MNKIAISFTLTAALGLLSCDQDAALHLQTQEPSVAEQDDEFVTPEVQEAPDAGGSAATVELGDQSLQLQTARPATDQADDVAELEAVEDKVADRVVDKPDDDQAISMYASSNSVRYWTPWSDGASRTSLSCSNKSFVSAFDAIGSSLDQIQLLCTSARAPSWSSSFWSRWIWHGVRADVSCPSNSWMVGAECVGPSCSAMRVRCAKSDKIQQGCSWSKRFDGSGSGSSRWFTAPSGHYLKGIRCHGFLCSELQYEYCQMRDRSTGGNHGGGGSRGGSNRQPRPTCTPSCPSGTVCIVAGDEAFCEDPNR